MGFLLIEALWFVIPAYAANSFPVLMKGKLPLDFRKSYKGKRILGDGKTFEGTIGGILFGFFLGTLQVLYQSQIPASWNLNLIQMTFPIVILMVLGTLAGQFISSFLKRRIGLERGAPLLIVDQLDFLVTALLFTALVFVPDTFIIVVLFIATPIIHWISNVFGYVIKFKQHPW